MKLRYLRSMNSWGSSCPKDDERDGLSQVLGLVWEDWENLALVPKG